MGGAMNTERVYINDIDIIDFNAKALRDYTIGGTPIENDYFQGRNRSNYTLMSTTYGLKPINITFVYQGDSRREASLNRSRLEAQLFDVFELYLPDGFYYRCMLDSIGEAETKGADGFGVMTSVKYKFLGIQHDPLVTIEDGTSFTAEGTLPKMDCILSVTVGASASSYYLGGAVFSNVQAGDVLVVDGIYKRFLKNGAPTTATDWVSFPSVRMGQNSFTAFDTVKVEFYPCYV
jgi:hypothetical protein